MGSSFPSCLYYNDSKKQNIRAAFLTFSLPVELGYMLILKQCLQYCEVVCWPQLTNNSNNDKKKKDTCSHLF